MNYYGEMAQRHWARWLPRQYAAIEDPDSFFARPGEPGGGEDRRAGRRAGRGRPAGRGLPGQGGTDRPGPAAGRGDRADGDGPAGTGTGDGPGDPAGLTPFRPRGQADLAPSGAVSRVRANLAALAVLRTVQRDARPATPPEQAVLARWSGWGAVPEVFDEDREEFAWARGQLAGLMSPAELAAARRTTINAHYTDAALAAVIWDGARKLGFTGGRVLEPGCGSGNFIGLAPDGAQVTGVELDPVTAGIAAALYPHARIRAESFADDPGPGRLVRPGDRQRAVRAGGAARPPPQRGPGTRSTTISSSSPWP